MAKRFLSNINVNDQYTLPSADGSSGQVIQTDGSGNLSFVDFASDEARKVIFTVKNKDSISLSKGTVVHASPSATPPSGNIIEVIRADNNDSSKMPAIGVLNETLAVDAEGQCVMLGSVSGIATNSFAIGDELYVSDTPGEFTNTKPTGNSNLIQKIAIVIKSHSTNGLIEVFGAGRSNDVPNQIDRNVNFTDNSKLTFGDSTTPDLQIYHDGNSVIADTGAGNLFLMGSASIRLTNVGATEHYAKFFENGAVELYYNNSKKFETTNTGVKTTGEIVVDGTTAAFANSGITLKRTGVLTGDADILLAGTSGSEALAFRINDSEKVRIDNSGNVGIGTDSPSKKLHIVGSIITGATADTNTLLYLEQNANNSIQINSGATNLGQIRFGDSASNYRGALTYSHSDDSMQFVSAGSERMRIDSSGDVGIGLTSPSHRLDLTTSDTTWAAAIKNTNATNGFGLFVQSAESASKAILGAYSGSSYKFYVRGDGNVGIGTNSPNAKLDIRQTIDGTGVRIYGYDDRNAEYLRIHDNGSSGVYGATGNVKLESGGSGYVFLDSNNDVFFDVGSSGFNFRFRDGSGNELVRIKGNGNVGIGTTSPNNFGFLEKVVHINAGTSSDTTLQQAGLVISGSSDADDADDFAYVSFLNNHSTLSNDRVAEIRVLKNGADVDTGEFAFFTANGTSLNEAMRINELGYVGINDNDPVYRLHVESADEIQAMFKSTDNKGAIRIADNDTNAYVSAENGLASFGHNIGANTGNININSSGNVGIGTTSPSAKLHIHNTATTSDGDGTATQTTSSQDSILLYGHGGTNGQTYGSITWLGGSRRRAMITAVAENTDTDFIGLAFYTQGTDGSGDYAESMRITRDGDVGIGTSSPVDNYASGITPETTKLAVHGGTSSGYTEVAHFAAGSDADDTGATVRIGHVGNDRGMFIKAGRGTSDQAKALLGVRISNNTDETILTMQQGGNVGIGTSSPAQKLQVASPSATSVVLGASYLSTNNNNFFETGINANDGYINLRNSGVQTTVHIDSDGDSFFNGGDVGIGVTSPQEALDVAGHIKLSEAGPVIIMHSENAASGGRINVTGLDGPSDDLLRVQDNGGTRFNLKADGDIANGLIPHTDSTYDLGSSTQRWANLYVDNIIGPGGDNSEEIARIVGWVEAYSNVNADTVRWNYTEDAMELQSNGDGSIGASFKAVRVKKDQVTRFTTMIKGSAASSTGVYLRLYQHNGDMPDGKTHVSNNATTSASVVQEDDSGVTTWHENSSVTTDWVTFEYDYTAPADGYVSLVVLNWTDFGTNSLYVKTPDIQTNIAGDKITLTQDDAADGYKLVRSGHDTYRMTLNASQGLYIVNDTDGRTEMAFRGNGTVSIGTTSPDADARFHLSGPSTSPSLSGTTPTSYTAIFSNSDTAYGTLFATQGNGNGLIQQRRTNNATFYNLFLQPHGGNVGIGNNTAATRLSVSSSGAEGISLTQDTTTTSNSGRLFFETDTASEGFSFMNSNGLMTIRSGAQSGVTSGSTRVAINTAGNVGINTTSPAEKLDVAGRVKITSSGGDAEKIIGTKNQALTENTFTTVLTVNMADHTGCYVKIVAFGDWNSHSSVQYLGEFFLTHGTGSYNEPGMIIREVDNTATDTIVAQIVQPSGTTGNRDFVIQLKADDTIASNGVTARITYEVMGQFNSVT